MRTIIYQSILEVDPSSWNSLAGDVLNSHEMLMTLEESRIPGVRLRYATVEENNGHVLAAAPIASISIDARNLTHGLFRASISGIRKFNRDFLRTNLILCGTPLSVGNAPARIRQGADPFLVMLELARVVEELGEEEGITWQAFKEFDQQERCAAQSALESRSWFLVPSELANSVSIPWSSYEDYLASLRSPYRRKIRKASRQMACEGLRVEEKPLSDVYDSTLHRLYESVVDRAPIQLERLNREFFVALGKNFGDRARILTFTRDRRVVGWVALLRDRGVVYDLFHGIDYDEIARSQLYFNQLAEVIRFAIQRGAHRLELGQSSNVAKARFGSSTKPLWLALRHTNPVIRALQLQNLLQNLPEYCPGPPIVLPS